MILCATLRASVKSTFPSTPSGPSTPTEMSWLQVARMWEVQGAQWAMENPAGSLAHRHEGVVRRGVVRQACGQGGHEANTHQSRHKALKARCYMCCGLSLAQPCAVCLACCCLAYALTHALTPTCVLTLLHSTGVCKVDKRVTRHVVVVAYSPACRWFSCQRSHFVPTKSTPHGLLSSIVSPVSSRSSSYLNSTRQYKRALA